MTSEEVAFLAGELPFKIPCPPPALHLPPPVYRMSPEIQRNASSPIPPPPLGARVPGDRIRWSPPVFPKSVAHQTTTSSLETDSGFEFNHSLTDVGAAVDISGDVPEPQAKFVGTDAMEAWKVVALEYSQPKESSEVSQSDSVISHSVLEINSVGIAAPDAESNSLIQEVKMLPSTKPQCPMIWLDDAPVSVAHLAEKLELKTCQVTNSLIDIGISLKPGAAISIRTASQIAKRFGFGIEVIPLRPSDGDVS